MFSLRMVPLTLLALVASARGQETDSRSPRTPEFPSEADRELSPRETEHEEARAEFLQARQEYSSLIAAAMTSREVTDWVRRIPVNVRLRRTERDLNEVRRSLDEIHASGLAGSEAERRLVDRAAILEVEIERLRRPDPAQAAAADAPIPERDVAVGWIHQEMAEETSLLADTLSTRELEQRTKRLRRLSGLARLAAGLRRGEPAGEAVIPAGGPFAPGDDGSLGNGTTAPPASLGTGTSSPPASLGTGTTTPPASLGTGTTTPSDLPEPSEEPGKPKADAPDDDGPSLPE